MRRLMVLLGGGLLMAAAVGGWAIASGEAGTQPATNPALKAIDTQGRTQKDYDAHIAALKKKLPEQFSVVQETPFVVCGDEPADAVERYADQTVAWAVKLLKKDFFAKDPEDLITVYLFRNDASYKKHAKLFFGDTPTTPYGYYSPRSKALVMNISTGGGTLVHEIVHPFMATNFPKCPPWFNEGLGSLFEQSGERDGHIVGYTNWRLAGLQKALKAGTVPSFEKLFAMGHEEFYTKDRGTNYAQARYLLYYLQEKGLLRGFYADFVKNQEKDPTGIETLKKTLGEKDMADFQKRWGAFVLELRYPE